MANNKNVETGSDVVINNSLGDAQLDSKTTGDPKPSKKQKKKSAKPGIGSRIKTFCKEIFSELKKVNWPTAKKVFSQLGTVLVVVVVFVAIVMAFDSLCGWLLDLLVGGTAA